MGAGQGLNTIFGTAEETVYGTPVVADRYYEILSESFERRNRILRSNGMRAGTRNLRRGARRVVSARDGGGDVKLEVQPKGFGRIFKHLLGGTPTIGAAVGGIYPHTYQLG